MIKSQHLHFAYPTYDSIDHPANILCGLDFTIEAGDFVAILGHNGSGKSTLAKHFNALLTPTEGVMCVNGHNTGDLANIWSIRQTVGMLFQNPDNQIVASVVEEDVAFGPENLAIPPTEIRKRVDDALAAVGMTGYSMSPPHHLSGGQKQRVAIAGVLAMLPSCIVLDEPTAMLDPVGRREVLETVTRLNLETGMTVVLITHFMEEAVLANRIIVMEHGEIRLDDTPRNVFNRVGDMRRLGLDVPQVTALAHSLKFSGELPITVPDFLRHPSMCKLPLQETSKPAQEHEPCSIEAPILVLQNLTHTYSEGTVFETKAVDDVSLSIKKGEIVSIIGHTGSGKSTLIQHFNALLTPTSGKVLLGGEDTHADKQKLAQIRQQVGLVFQYPEHQLFESTVYKDVAFGPKQMKLSDDEVDERVRTALALVGLPESLHDVSPFELSGGEKRRAAIAGVLAMRPQVLVLDEPTAGLDPAGRNAILSQIRHMHHALGITVILVSHSMDDVARLSSRIFVMNDGRLMHQGTPQQIFAQADELLSIGLDTPQICQLFQQLNKKNPSLPVGVFTVEDAVALLRGCSN